MSSTPRRFPPQPRLIVLAIEPTGEGPYCEAVREWIEQITPRPAPEGFLRLVR